MGRRNSRFSYLLLGGVIVCLLASAYLSFELGRYSAGFSLFDIKRDKAEMQAVMDDQAKTIDDLQRQVAILQTALEVDRETYAQVEASSARLQAQIQTQNEELAFYQGIVSPEDGTTGLRVQSLDIEAGDSEREFNLRLVLVQAIVQSQNVSGSVKLKVSGLLNDAEVEYELPALVTDDSKARIGYEFRYFQTIERELVLPEGFLAKTVQLEISPSTPRGDPIVANYRWATASG